MHTVPLVPGRNLLVLMPGVVLALSLDTLIYVRSVCCDLGDVSIEALSPLTYISFIQR